MPGRETVQDKAQRLVNERRFTRLHEHVWVCQGDNGKYLVCVPDAKAAQRAGVRPGSCTCEARDLCSHMRGAAALERHLAGGGTYP